MKHAVVIPLSHEHADELRDCGTVGAAAVTVDRDSECYRAWREKHQRSRGLGDTIAKLTSAVGIKPCPPCKQRQAKLNQLVPYRH